MFTAGLRAFSVGPAGLLLHVYLHRERHCSGPFDMQLVYENMPQESGSYQCRTAHINAERLISVQTDMQTNIDMYTDIDADMDMDMEFSLYIYGPFGLEKIGK
jgi:hypothetical protein